VSHVGFFGPCRSVPFAVFAASNLVALIRCRFSILDTHTPDFFPVSRMVASAYIAVGCFLNCYLLGSRTHAYC
ncbi:hypothetical protein F5Y00DRAFT_248644, partial [Daldinia vernicosa]|uniref:uncharacterized protein n=1 Tax=Daldinia vernicosa TaxID=114800 RepID=UPI002008875F